MESDGISVVEDSTRLEAIAAPSSVVDTEALFVDSESNVLGHFQFVDFFCDFMEQNGLRGVSVNSYRKRLLPFHSLIVEDEIKGGLVSPRAAAIKSSHFSQDSMGSGFVRLD